MIFAGALASSYISPHLERRGKRSSPASSHRGCPLLTLLLQEDAIDSLERSSLTLVGLEPFAGNTGHGSISCVAVRSVTAAGPGAEKAAGPGLPLGVLVCSAKPLTRAVKRQTRTKITHGFSQP